MGDFPGLGQFASVSMAVPYMTREHFANQVGLPVGVVEGWIDRGYVPTIVVGRYSLVNVALLTKQALLREFR